MIKWSFMFYLCTLTVTYVSEMWLLVKHVISSHLCSTNVINWSLKWWFLPLLYLSFSCSCFSSSEHTICCRNPKFLDSGFQNHKSWYLRLWIPKVLRFLGFEIIYIDTSAFNIHFWGHLILVIKKLEDQREKNEEQWMVFYSFF